MVSATVVAPVLDMPGGVPRPHVGRVGRALVAARALLRLGRPRPHGAPLGHRPPPAAQDILRTSLRC